MDNGKRGEAEAQLGDSEARVMSLGGSVVAAPHQHPHFPTLPPLQNKQRKRLPIHTEGASSKNPFN